mgnify:CR=1 FL=1
MSTDPFRPFETNLDQDRAEGGTCHRTEPGDGSSDADHGSPLRAGESW